MSKDFRRKYGSYAIVIGASAGIGEAFAKELAKLGMNLVLVARRLDKLEALSKSLQQQFQIDAKCISLDLSQDGAVDTLAQETESLDVGLLILSAGVSYIGGFVKIPYEQEVHTVTMNVMVPTQIAYRIGNRMKQKKRGGILFVSSLGGKVPAPYQATYAATKAYITSLGRALAFEFARDGVDVSILAPGMTDTEGMRNIENFDSSKLQGMAMMDPNDVAKAGLSGMGNKLYIIPGSRNRLVAFIFGLMPQSTLVNIFGKMMINAVNKDVQ